MPDLDERPERSGGFQQLTDKVYDVKRDVAVMGAQLTGLQDKVKEGFAEVSAAVREMNTKFVSREEHENLKGEVKDVRANLSRGAWIVLGAVFTAIVYGVLKTGVVHL